MVKQAKADAEHGRVSIRNARRDANNMLKDLLKEKEITEDDQRRGEDLIQKLTDQYIAEVDKALTANATGNATEAASAHARLARAWPHAAGF